MVSSVFVNTNIISGLVEKNYLNSLNFTLKFCSASPPSTSVRDGDDRSRLVLRRTSAAPERRPTTGEIFDVCTLFLFADFPLHFLQSPKCYILV